SDSATASGISVTKSSYLNVDQRQQLQRARGHPRIGGGRVVIVTGEVQHPVHEQRERLVLGRVAVGARLAQRGLPAEGDVANVASKAGRADTPVGRYRRPLAAVQCRRRAGAGTNALADKSVGPTGVHSPTARERQHVRRLVYAAIFAVQAP